MRYEIDIENDDVLTLGDVAGALEIILSGPSLSVEQVSFHLNELQLEELISAIDLIKAVRPKKCVNIPPAGVRSEVQSSGSKDWGHWGYSPTSTADNPDD